MLTRVTGAQAASVLASLEPYKQMLEPQRQHLLGFYRAVDVAMKIVGTGSVGTRDYVVLMFGIGEDDPLFLQVKQEMPSCYAPFLDEPQQNQRRELGAGRHDERTADRGQGTELQVQRVGDE